MQILTDCLRRIDLDLKELIDLSEDQLNEYARQRYVVRNGTEVGFEPPYEKWDF